MPHKLSNNPLLGAMYFVRGLQLIIQPGIRRFVLVPLLVNAVLFTTLIFFGAGQLHTLLGTMLPAWLEWLSWLVVPLFLLASLVILFFAFNIVANFIASPFNGLLAEAVEQHLRGHVVDQSIDWTKVLGELAHTLKSELRKLGYIAVRTLPLLVLFLIPVVNIVAPALWFILTAWLLVLSYVDYPMANHGLSFSEQRTRLGEHRYLAMGFGGAVVAALAVPILNFIVIPCAVAGATAMWVERLCAEPPSSPKPVGPASPGGGEKTP